MRARCKTFAVLLSVLLLSNIGKGVLGAEALMSGEHWMNGIGEEKDKGEEELKGSKQSSISMLEEIIDPDSYVLGPYDCIVINIMGPEPRSFDLTVLPEGDVFLPGVGAIRADGRTLTEFRRQLGKQVNKFFRNISLYCYLKTPRVFRVFVTGEVGNPGVVKVSAIERVSDAVGKVGGIRDNGSMRLITLERGGEKIRVDLLRFLLKGDFTNNPFLRGGDRIHVPIAGLNSSILGHVRKPGQYEIIPGETVGELIDLAGGFTAIAIRDSVMLSRLEATGISSTVVLPADRFGTKLEDLDEVNTFDALQGSRSVFVFGAANRTGRFYLAPGEGLAELLVRVGGITKFADLDAASLERSNGELIRLDLRRFILPESPENLSLEDGDVLNIPEIFQTIAVSGEVQAPGQFPYRGDLTVAHYIGLAGGPTRDGCIDRILLYSPDGSSRKANGDTRPDRGDVIVVRRGRYKIFAEFLSGVIRLGTVVVSIIVLTK